MKIFSTSKKTYFPWVIWFFLDEQIFISPPGTGNKCIKYSHIPDFVHVFSLVKNCGLNHNCSVIYLSRYTFLDTSLCQCPCSQVKNGSSYTAEELQVLLSSSLKKLEKELKVDKKLLSSYVSKHVSASDDRQSSRSLGIGGIVCLCLMAAAILGMDLMSIKRHTATAKGICLGRPQKLWPEMTNIYHNATLIEKQNCTITLE